MSAHRNPRWLREKYIDEAMPIMEIADMCGVSRRVIYYHLHKQGISTSRKHKPKMQKISVYFPIYFLDSVRVFSEKSDKPLSTLIREALNKYMLEGKYNTFTNRRFRDKNV